MLKRTKGYLLLILLVVTGLASQVSNNTISSKERRHLTHHLKETRDELLQSIKGLSHAQLAFKPSPDQWSIRHCMQHITLAEVNLKTLAEETLKEKANRTAGDSAMLTDAAILHRISSSEHKMEMIPALSPAANRWKTDEEMIEAFKETHNALVKFTRTTTDDLRSHITDAPFGRVDVYQVVLGISAHTARHTRQIEAIKANAAFPKH
jgi:hypothetical protein